jgi:hypothetical protein
MTPNVRQTLSYQMDSYNFLQEIYLFWTQIKVRQLFKHFLKAWQNSVPDFFSPSGRDVGPLATQLLLNQGYQFLELKGIVSRDWGGL